ncbi:alpha/beta fold hydrolase [Nocardia vinacea]|uniref:Alpha/beta fold hydrolase n=1 Tax=Nocardia vinacea TaxID=96468 RepID=A0ABZ1YTS4_9NOCA|nr:alpha/beta hydrolase [Nocardia vinacea]
MKAEVKVSRVALGDVEIHLNESGDPQAPAVLFLHGSGPGATGASNWEAVLSDLGDRYHCLAPDVLGFGNSSHPNPPPDGLGPFTQQRIDTIVALLEKLGIERASFVGNSMGGMWSIGATVQHPEVVDKLVLMGAGGAPAEFLGPSLPGLVNFYDDPSPAAMTKLLTEFLYEPAILGGRLEDIAAARLPQAVRPEVERSHRATFDLRNPWQITEEQLTGIEHETLIIHGREDSFVTLGGGLYYFQKIPNARLYGIGKCGHWTQIEHRDRFVAALRGFLEGRL